MTKSTLTSLSDTQYRFFLWLIVFSLSVAAAPSAAGFYILGELGGSTATVSYGVSFFVLGELLTKPYGLIFGEKIGKVRLLKICLIVQLFLTVPLFMVSNYWAYLALRFLSGLAVGPVFIIGTSMCGNAVGPLKKRKVFTFLPVMITLLITVPIISAAAGALIAYQYDWRLVYVAINIIPIALLLIAPVLFLGEESCTNENPIDWIGVYAYSVGLFGLGFCLITEFEIDGLRSIAFNISLYIGALHFLFFLVWNSFQKDPILDFSFFKQRSFLLNSFYSFALYMLFYAIIVMLSLWLHLYVYYSINWVALSLVSILMAPIVLTIIYKYSLSPKGIVFVTGALLLLSISSFYISTFNVNVNFGRIIFIKLIVGIAIIMALPYVINQLIRACKEDCDVPKAFAVWAVVRVGASFVGTAYFTTLWQKRAVFYHTRLGGELTQFSQNTKAVLDKLSSFHMTSKMKLEALNTALNEQSYALALDDCYYVIGWVMLGLAFISLIDCYHFFKKEPTAE